MGSERTILKEKGYNIEKKETENVIIATKGEEKFLIQRILCQRSTYEALNTEIQSLNITEHPHIVSSKNSFKDEDTYYVVMDYCQGGNLAEKIKQMTHPPEEFEALSMVVEMCLALKTIHEKHLLHKHLTPETVLFTEFGTVCLGGFGQIYESSKKEQSTSDSNQPERINHLAPEVFTNRTYDAKSDIWSVGTILYEFCTQQQAFSAKTTLQLISKITDGPYPDLPKKYSSGICQLLSYILKEDPQSRPTANEILEHPFVINCLKEKCKTTVKELQTKLSNLRGVADGLERVHQRATIGSLTGGVIGAVGGITSIVGLILAPFTLGASLIVTGVGVGVSAVGGITAGVSNITNMVNQSSDRKAIRKIITEIKEKINAVVLWLQEISNGLQRIRSLGNLPDTPSTGDSQLNTDNLTRLGSRAGRGIGGIAELVRLVQVLNIGKIAAQASRAVRAAEAATGVLSGLFVAVDLFFIAMDAKEIHHIRQAQAERQRSDTFSETETSETELISDQASLVNSSLMSEVSFDNADDQSEQSAMDQSPEIKSEVMKFVKSIREAADNLQAVLDELKSIISSIPLLERQ